MLWRSCGGRSWLAVSRSVDAGTWVSSCMRSGFASIPRPASGSLPNAGCVGTSLEGLPILRSIWASTIQHTSTTDDLLGCRASLGGARPGAGPIAPGLIADGDVTPVPPIAACEDIEPISGGTQASSRLLATNRTPGGGWSGRVAKPHDGAGLTSNGEVDPQPNVVRRSAGISIRAQEVGHPRPHETRGCLRCAGNDVGRPGRGERPRSQRPASRGSRHGHAHRPSATRCAAPR